MLARAKARMPEATPLGSVWLPLAIAAALVLAAVAAAGHRGEIVAGLAGALVVATAPLVDRRLLVPIVILLLPLEIWEELAPFSFTSDGFADRMARSTLLNAGRVAIFALAALLAADGAGGVGAAAADRQAGRAVVRAAGAVRLRHDLLARPGPGRGAHRDAGLPPGADDAGTGIRARPGDPAPLPLGAHRRDDGAGVRRDRAAGDGHVSVEPGPRIREHAACEHHVPRPEHLRPDARRRDGPGHRRSAVGAAGVACADSRERPRAVRVGAAVHELSLRVARRSDGAAPHYRPHADAPADASGRDRRRDRRRGDITARRRSRVRRDILRARRDARRRMGRAGHAALSSSRPDGTCFSTIPSRASGSAASKTRIGGRTRTTISTPVRACRFRTRR